MAKTYSQLPSDIFGTTDSIAAWMLNEAVTWFGVTIENALLERVEVGTKSQPKYTLARLLHEKFRMPAPQPEIIDMPNQGLSPWAAFLPWIGKPGSGINRWVYVPPVEDEKEH